MAANTAGKAARTGSTAACHRETQEAAEQLRREVERTIDATLRPRAGPPSRPWQRLAGRPCREEALAV